MTKKEVKQIYDECAISIPYHVDKVLWAIIDALPDEPGWKTKVREERLAHHEECRRNLGGPEPVEVKESQPTSEFCRHCGAGIGKHRRYGEGTCIHCVDLGPQQPPNVASHAQPRSEDDSPLHKMLDERERKLRIMKAMEDISKDRADFPRFFISKEGKWCLDTVLGRFPIDENYSPKEPLWEG